MDEIFTTIKNFILNDVNYELIQLAEQAVPLPAVTADNILFGTVDLSRYSAPVVVAVLPDNQEPDDSFIDGFSDRSEFVVTFLFQKALYPLLVKRMCRYAKAFRKALAKIDPKAFVTLHKIDSVWGQDKDFQDIKKIDMA